MCGAIGVQKKNLVVSSSSRNNIFFDTRLNSLIHLHKLEVKSTIMRKLALVTTFVGI